MSGSDLITAEKKIWTSSWDAFNQSIQYSTTKNEHNIKPEKILQVLVFSVIEIA